MATDRFHKDKKARSARRRIVASARARSHDGVFVDCGLDGAGTLEPVDAFFRRIAAGYEPEEIGVSASVSQTYLHPNPDRRALVDAWLSEHQGETHEANPIDC